MKRPPRSLRSLPPEGAGQSLGAALRNETTPTLAALAAPRGGRSVPRGGPSVLTDVTGSARAPAASAPAASATKVATRADALARIAALPRPLVMTNGVFDLLHRGHVAYLEEARALGAALVVAVNSDASVKRLGKGADRPLNTLDDRMAVLAALAASTSSCRSTTTRRATSSSPRCPTCWSRAATTPPQTTAGAAEVIAHGGRFVAIPFDVRPLDDRARSGASARYTSAHDGTANAKSTRAASTARCPSCARRRC